jgi:hypothetical protein
MPAEASAMIKVWQAKQLVQREFGGVHSECIRMIAESCSLLYLPSNRRVLPRQVRRVWRQRKRVYSGGVQHYDRVEHRSLLCHGSRTFHYSCII